MTQVFMDITGAQGAARKTGPLTAGMVGVPVTFSFSPEWAELNCLAVFRAGEVKKDNAITDGCSVIPAEVLQCPGQRLYLGVEGRSKQGDVVIPTVWAEVGQILEGAQASNDPALAPTPSQFERFMAQVEQVEEKIESALQEAKDSGRFDGPPGDDYVLTESDKTEIAKQAAGMVDSGVSIDASAVVITVDGAAMTADKTNAEIYEAYLAAKPTYLLAEMDGTPCLLQPAVVMQDRAVFTSHSGTTALTVSITEDVVCIERHTLAKREEIPALPENVSAFHNDKGYQTAEEVARIVEEAIGGIEIPESGEENIIPVETVLAEGTVASGAASWTPNDTGVSIATLNQYKRIRLAIKGASNVSNFWAFQFTTQNVTDTNRIANASGMAVVLRKISDGCFRVESIESKGSGDTVLKGMVAKNDSWLSVRTGSISPVVLNLTSYDESATLKIAPVNATTIDYTWAVCGYNC